MSEKVQALTSKHWKAFQEAYDQKTSNRAVESAIRGVGIDQTAQDPEVVKRHSFLFEKECKQGEPTNQKKSGRCWYFAALNSLRQIVMEKLNVETFEFSQTHLYFYDKLEKANTYLENMIRLADRDPMDREYQAYLDSTVYDGGFWDYFVALCLKYGLVPKQEGPETFHSEDSYMFTKQMDVRLKRTAMQIRKAKAAGKSAKHLREMKIACLSEIYEIAVKCLGRPVETFNYAYKDKDKNFKRIEGMTPLKFFEKYVGKKELESRVVLLSDPREIHPYGRVLRLPAATNVLEALPAGGLNVPLDVLSDAVLASIQAEVPCWFACDVGKDIDRKKGLLDCQLFRYDEVLPPIGEFSKADRFASGYSQATHAMNITGVDCDAEGHPLFWKVENSWGEDNGKKGTYSMSHEWFLAYTYEAIIDQKFVPKKYLAGLKEPEIELEPWDMLGRSMIF